MPIYSRPIVDQAAVDLSADDGEDDWNTWTTFLFLLTGYHALFVDGRYRAEVNASPPSSFCLTRSKGTISSVRRMRMGNYNENRMSTASVPRCNLPSHAHIPVSYISSQQSQTDVLLLVETMHPSSPDSLQHTLIGCKTRRSSTLHWWSSV